MKKQDVQRRPKSHVNSWVISFRITPSMAAFIKAENLSPRAIVIKACQEFGYKPEDLK